MSAAGGAAAAKRTGAPRQTKKRIVEQAEPKQDTKRKATSAAAKGSAVSDKAPGKVRSADSAAAEVLASLTQPEVQKAETAAAAAAAAAAAPAAAAPEEDEAKASRPPEAPPAMAAGGAGPTPAGPALEAAAAAAEAQRAKLEAAAQGSPPASASGTHEAWQHKTGPTTVSAAAAAMPTQDFAGIVGESGGQDTRLDQHPLQYGGGQYMPQAGGVPPAGHPMDANGYQQAVQGHNVTVRPAPFNPAAKPATTPTLPAGPGAEPETTQWYGCVKHRLVTPHAPARTVELFSAHAYLPYAIAERLPRSIFLDDLATRDQVMLSGRHLRVSFQLGPLSDKQREKLQGLAAMKAVGIARLQQCSLVVVPEADRELATGQPVAMTVFVLVDF